MTVDDAFYDIKVWRRFLWWLVSLLTGYSLLPWLLSKLGAVVAANLSSRFSTMFLNKQGNAPIKELHSRVVELMIKSNSTAGGKWGIDDKLEEMLTEEAHGWSSAIWILAAVWLAAVQAGFPLGRSSELLQKAVVTLLTWRVVSIVNRGVDIMGEKIMTKLSTDEASLVHVGRALKSLIGLMGFLFALSNFGYNISAMLTGVGLSGLMLGLSSQAALQDFVCWCVMVSQRPFITGDCVSVQGSTTPGIVEKIGFQMTEVRPLDGELMVFRNSKILDFPIVNHSHLPKRRNTINFEVSSLVPAAKLPKIPDYANAAVASEEHCEVAICWMSEVTHWGFKFTLFYFVNHDDVNVSRMANTSIWAKLLESLEKSGITLAGADRQRAFDRAHWPAMET